jgi:ABC-type uncharacterized transport system ATPase subunit
MANIEPIAVAGHRKNSWAARVVPLGANGAGETTTLKNLCREPQILGGEVPVFGGSARARLYQLPS